VAVFTNVERMEGWDRRQAGELWASPQIVEGC
jgi:hypothetical protein